MDHGGRGSVRAAENSSGQIGPPFKNSVHFPGEFGNKGDHSCPPNAITSSV